MATITPTVQDLAGGAQVITWTAITHADGGGAAKPGLNRPDKTIQAFGTFAGGLSLALEGSMNGTNWAPVYSLSGSIAAGNAIVFTAAGSAVVAGNYRQYRITRTSGSASSVTIAMSAVGG